MNDPEIPDAEDLRKLVEEIAQKAVRRLRTVLP